MGTTDTVTKIYMRENTIFADAFNFFIYGGKPVIDAEKLTAIDTEELALPYKEENGSKEKNANGTPVQKYRDLLKSAAIMSDGQTNYLLLGIENQSEIHYAMPVRNALYDALQYSRQIEDTAARHRSQKDYSGHSSGEFLSGFFKENRLIPVITLVIFFGP